MYLPPQSSHSNFPVFDKLPSLPSRARARCLIYLIFLSFYCSVFIFFLLRFWAPEFWDFRRSCLAFCLAGWQCQSLRVPTISPYQLWPHVFCLLFCFSFHFSFFGNYIDHGEHTGTRVFVHQSWQIVVFSNRVLYR